MNKLAIEYVSLENNNLKITQIGNFYSEKSLLGKILFDFMDHSIKVMMKMANKEELIKEFNSMYGKRITNSFKELLKDFQNSDSIRIKIYEG